MIRFLQSGNKAAKYLLSGFLLIICLGMVVYLIPGFMSDTSAAGGSTGVVASVAGQDIRRDQITKLVQAQMRQNRYPEMFAPMLAQQAYQRLLQEAEVKYAAQRLGLKVSDSELRDELQNGQYKQIFFPGGKWIGQDKYEELLKENQTTVEEFESSMRDGLLVRKLFSAVGAGVTVSQAEVEDAYKDRNTKVKFQYALLNLDDLLKQIKPTDAELKAYYEANKGRYANAIPEKRQVRYFVLGDKEAEAKVTVDAGDLQRYYSQNQDQFRVPERVRVRHILITTPPAGPDGKVDQKGVDEARAKAQDVLKQVRAGGNFAELADKYSQDPGNKGADGKLKGGELGWIVKGQMVPEFEKTSFSQSPGQISDLVQTSYGFHIVQTEEKEPARLKPLSEVKAQIEPLVKAQKVSAILNTTANDAQDLAQKQGLDKAAAKYGTTVIQSNPVSRADALPGVGPAPEVMTSIFTSAEKSGPQVARFAQGFVIFEISKIEPARAPALDEIKARVTTDFKNERATTQMQRKTQEMADRAHSEHDLAKAAKEAGAVVKTSELVGRQANVPDIGSMGGPASAAFSLKKGEISGPLNLGQKGAVLAVVERQEPSVTDELFAAQRDQLREELGQQKREQALGLFLSNLNSQLEKAGKIKVNKTEMENLTKRRG